MLQVSKPILGRIEEEAISRVMRSGYLGMGPEVSAFEKELQIYLGGKVEVVCVSSGTAALHLSISALGLGPGDEVLVPSLTFVASFQAVSATGATPVSCDVCLSSGLLDLKDAEKKVNSRTKAIMPVHYASLPLLTSEIRNYQALKHLRVVEDAAHSFGSKWNESLIGVQGDITCFSFDPIKNITCGEGGAVVTSDREVADRVRLSRRLGIQNDQVNSQGFRYHMNDMMAAVGRVQLQSLEISIRPHRKKLWDQYCFLLSKIQGLKLLDVDPRSEILPHIMVLRILDGKRDLLREKLKEQGIESKIHYPPNHLLQKYKSPEALPMTERLHQELITLPLHLGVNSEDVAKICQIIQETLKITPENFAPISVRPKFSETSPAL